MNDIDLKNIEPSEKYVIFYFPYTWIRDKQLIHKGDKYSGMLIIAEDDGTVVRMYGYEMVSDNYKT